MVLLDGPVALDGGSEFKWVHMGPFSLRWPMFMHVFSLSVRFSSLPSRGGGSKLSAKDRRTKTAAL